MLTMSERVAELAFQGSWAALFELLREHPNLVNHSKEPKGYTPLHQAAWHGASPAVIGQLLALGANPKLKTVNKNQTACEIAHEKHEARSDLQFLLAEQGRTIAQVMRKIVAETPGMFSLYDGNKILCDQLITAFGADTCYLSECDFEARLVSAYQSITGIEMSSLRPVQISISDHLKMEVSPDFWISRFLPLLREFALRLHTTPLERHWSVMSDLFHPAPSQWGHRGDPFLWLEMRQALCHVPIPARPEAVASIVNAAFTALTGEELSSIDEMDIPRFGPGASGVMVSSEFWIKVFIPMLQQRAKWLHESWDRS